MRNKTWKNPLGFKVGDIVSPNFITSKCGGVPSKDIIKAKIIDFHYDKTFIFKVLEGKNPGRESGYTWPKNFKFANDIIDNYSLY